MRKRRWTIAGAVLLVTAVAIAAGLAMRGSSQGQGLTKVTLQSKWVVQSQFAGYYAAQAKGYYKQAGLDVTIKAGGPDILPEQVVLGRQAEFGINWMPSPLAQRDTGNDLVNIGQVYAAQRYDRGHVQVERASTRFRKMRGKEVRRLDLRERVRAARGARQERHEPGQGRQLVKQNFDMLAFLKRRDRRRLGDDVQRARAGARGEEPGDRQAVHAHRPATSSSTRTSAQECCRTAIIVRGDWIKDAKNQATAVKFLEASFKGWIYCRDHSPSAPTSF